MDVSSRSRIAPQPAKATSQPVSSPAQAPAGSVRSGTGISAFEGSKPLPAAERTARSALEKEFATKLTGDEALRADLSDEELKPMLDRALQALHNKAFSVDDPGSDKARAQMETTLTGLKVGIRLEETSRRGLELAFTERLLDNKELRGRLPPGQFQKAFERSLADVRHLAWTLPQPGSGDAQLAMENLYRSLVQRFTPST
jgi:hypothetical protein